MQPIDLLVYVFSFSPFALHGFRVTSLTERVCSL